MKKHTKKKGFQWFKMLTKKQQKQYKKNIINSTLIQKDWFWWLKIRMNSVDGAYIFIALSFDMDNNPQGREYWNEVIKRLENN